MCSPFVPLEGNVGTLLALSPVWVFGHSLDSVNCQMGLPFGMSAVANRPRPCFSLSRAWTDGLKGIFFEVKRRRAVCRMGQRTHTRRRQTGRWPLGRSLLIFTVDGGGDWDEEPVPDTMPRGARDPGALG